LLWSQVAFDPVEDGTESLAIICNDLSVVTDLSHDLGVLLDDADDVLGVPGLVHVFGTFIQGLGVLLRSFFKINL